MGRPSHPGVAKVRRSPDALPGRFRETRVVPEHESVPTTSRRVTELIESGRDREAAELGGTATSGEQPDEASDPDEAAPDQ